MSKLNARNLSIIAVGLFVFFLLGCGSSSSGPSAAETQAYNKQRGVDPDKAKKFLDAFAAVPAAQRKDFANAHPDDMRNLGMVQDRAIQERFQEIIRGSK